MNNNTAAALSPATLAALRNLTDGRDHDRAAPHYALVRAGLAVVSQKHDVLDPAICDTHTLAKVRITAAGRKHVADVDAAEAAHYDAMAERAFAQRCAEGF